MTPGHAEHAEPRRVVGLSPVGKKKIWRLRSVSKARREGHVTLSFPLAVIDFEASGLGSASYPIEAGVAIARIPGTGIETWSTLICPHPTWRERGSWDRRAQDAHGISPAMLAEGMDPTTVLARLNDLLAPIGHAWCDGGGFDQFWFERLCEAAPRVKPAFVLWDVKGLFVLNRRAHNRFAEILARGEPPHRAGPDAARICAAADKSFRGIGDSN